MDLPDADLFAALEDLCAMQRVEHDDFFSVHDFERELLKLPADVGFSVAYHALYPRLVEAHFNVRRLSEKDSSDSVLERKRKSVSEQVWKLTASEDGQKIQQRLSADHFLNEFMFKYVMIVDSLHLELQDLYLQLQANCNDFLEEVQQLCEVTHVSAPRGPQRKKKTWNFEKKTLQMNIKEKFSDAIQVLKKEFQSRQKKGKLPTDATGLLKFWWEKNFNWPYPSVSFLEAVLFFRCI